MQFLHNTQCLKVFETTPIWVFFFLFHFKSGPVANKTWAHRFFWFHSLLLNSTSQVCNQTSRQTYLVNKFRWPWWHHYGPVQVTFSDSSSFLQNHRRHYAVLVMKQSDLNSFKPRFPMLRIVSAGPFELKQKPAAQRQACKLPHIDYYTALVRYLY